MDLIEALLSEAAAFCLEHGRPMVTLSYAQSLDGSLAARRGAPLALSGLESMRLTHRLRAAHAAILVGIGTVLADDPRLSVRLVEGSDPQPVVLDSRLRTPLNANLLCAARPLWIACLDGADPARLQVLQAAGAQVLALPPSETGGVSLPALLQTLARRGIASLMVEGGARLIGAFLAAGLADQAVITVAPLFVGGLHAIEAGALAGAMPRMASTQTQRYGDDLVVWGKIIY
jgi:3,4-dihydroxy 2-butanone 4-phosphate synthase/GTP cyclohydrolase II